MTTTVSYLAMSKREQARCPRVVVGYLLDGAERAAFTLPADTGHQARVAARMAELAAAGREGIWTRTMTPAFVPAALR